MNLFYCPRCGSNASILLNLVSCVTSTCKNYDAKWEHEWKLNNSPRFIQPSLPGSEHRFLGRHDELVGTKRMTFDLHFFKNKQHVYVCIARYGNSDNECYYVDEKETEIGCMASGPVASCSQPIVSALKEALKRFRRR